MLVLGISIYLLMSFLCLVFFHGENRLISAFQPILIGYQEVLRLKRKRPQIELLYFRIFLRIAIDILIVLVVGSILLLVGPFLYLWKGRQNRIEAAEREQEQKRFDAEQLEKAVQSRLAENERRLAVARWWFESHPPILYYNTMVGLTAVLTPQAFEEARIATERAKRNETWTPVEVFVPHAFTVLFATVTGKETSLKNCRSGIVSHWLTDLDDLEEKWSARLEQRREIFVPYVNDSVLSHREQYSIIHRLENLRDVEARLILSQLPKEIQPAY